MGCAAAAKQAAETAAPAAVEGAVEKVSEPSTRDAVAEILEDDDIRSSSAELSAAVAQGFARGIEQEVPMAQAQRVADALAASVGASLARSLERDVAPRMSILMQRMIDESFNHALNEQNEARLQAVVASLTRATVDGASEAFAQTMVVNHEDPLSAPSAKLTREAWYGLGYNGAHGFEQAVREANLQSAEQPSVLATLGTLASWTRALPLVLVGFAAIVVLGLMTALVWALVALKRERRWARDRVAHESAAEAHRTGHDAEWFDEFAKHVARAARHGGNLSSKAP